MLAGKGASVAIGSTAYAFDEVKISMKNKLAEVSNFTGGGYRQFISGLSDAKLTCSGPYDSGNMPFEVGSAYTLIVTYTSGTSLSVPTLCESIDPDVKVDDAERISLGFQSTGSASLSIS